MCAVFNSNGISRVWVDNSALAAIELTAYVKEVDGLEKVYAVLDKTTLSDTAEASAVGIQLKLTITLRGDYNDAALGPHVLFTGILGDGVDHTVKVTLDGTYYFQFEALCTRYAAPPRNKELVQYEVTLVSNGAVSIA